MIPKSEIIRITKLQVGKKCKKCRVGTIKNYGAVFCNNCGKRPFKIYYL
jgi:uncharacterized Zn finger protein (UPF0148 family)